MSPERGVTGRRNFLPRTPAKLTGAQSDTFASHSTEQKLGRKAYQGIAQPYVLERILMSQNAPIQISMLRTRGQQSGESVASTDHQR